MIKRKAAFTAIADDDDDEDIPVSYCPRCKEYGFNNIMKERIYPNGEPKPSDHENWLHCWTCNTIVAKVHAQRLDEISGIKEPDNNIHDYPGKVAIEVMNSSKKRRKMIDQFKKNRIGYDRDNFEDKDPDIQRMLDNGKQLVSYSEESQK
jgi:hypothetical protein